MTKSSTGSVVTVVHGSRFLIWEWRKYNSNIFIWSSWRVWERENENILKIVLFILLVYIIYQQFQSFSYICSYIICNIRVRDCCSHHNIIINHNIHFSHFLVSHFLVSFLLAYKNEFIRLCFSTVSPSPNTPCSRLHSTFLQSHLLHCQVSFLRRK